MNQIVEYPLAEMTQLFSLLKDVDGGWDFCSYSTASMGRQLKRAVERYHCGSLSNLIDRVRRMTIAERRQLCDSLTVNVTDLFRDPEVFSGLVEQVFPYLSEFANIKIWLAGCATGEEAFSLAILLDEHGLLGRSQILASDLSMTALRSARSGVVKTPLSKECATRYRLSGGQASLLDYFSLQYGQTKLKQEYLKRIHFVQHGLPGSPPVKEVQLVLCRNVVIYFNALLKGHSFGCLTSSLSQYGYLVLGPKETLEFSPYHRHFKLVSGPERIYKSYGTLS